MLAELVRVTAQLMTFRKGPQDFPFSQQAFQVCAAVVVLANFLQFQITVPPAAALFQAVLHAAVIAGVIYLMLKARGLENRMQQSCAAMFAVSAAFGLLGFPFLLEVSPVMLELAQQPQQQIDPEMLPRASILALFALFIWGLMVTAHLLRHALSVTAGAAVAMAIFVAVVLPFLVAGLTAGVGQ